MPTPITADLFIGRGASPEQAAVLAADHNRAAGIRTEEPSPTSGYTAAPARLAPPTPNPSPIAAPTDAQRAASEMDQIRRDRADGKISDHQWRTTFERKYHELAGIASTVDGYLQGTDADRSRIRNEWAADEVQQAMERSIDQGMKPAASPSDYLTSIAPSTPEEAAIDTEFRHAMFDAAVPREMGNALSADVDDTARVLSGASPEQTEAYMAAQESAMRRLWGSQTEAKIALAREYLAEHMGRSPMLRGLLEQHPELFSSWRTVAALARLAESRRRTGRGVR
jgi:hypothetical protein